MNEVRKICAFSENALKKEVTDRKKKRLVTFSCKVLGDQSQVKGSASSIRPGLRGFHHYDTLNTGGAGKHRGGEAVDELGSEQLLNCDSALFVPRRHVEVGPSGTEGGLPEGVVGTETESHEGINYLPHKPRLNDDHKGLLRDALVIGVIVRGYYEGAVFNYYSLQTGKGARGYPGLGGGPRPADQKGNEVITGFVGVYAGATINVLDFHEARDDMNVLVEIGREYFGAGLQDGFEGEQGRQRVGDGDDQGATLPPDQHLCDDVGVTKAHTLVHPGP